MLRERGGLGKLKNLHSPGSTEVDGGAEGLGPAAIFLILVLGASLTFLIWQNLSRNEQYLRELETQRYASALSREIEARIAHLDDSLRRRAQKWTMSSYAADPESWRADVDIVIAENPEILAVLRADPSWEIAGTTEGRQILREVLPEARRERVDADGDFLAGPLAASGRPALFGLQVRSGGEIADARTVFAVLDGQVLLQGVLGTRALGYGVDVSANGTSLYDRAPADRPDELAKVETVLVPNGSPWTIELWPLQADPLASAFRGSRLALATGLAGSILLAAAVHFGTLAWRRERLLRRANSALEKQIDDTRRGEGELRGLSEMLEARVAARTAELNETIVELETFNYSVSHDLRGPLGAVINFAAILSEDYADRLDATGKDHLQRIVGSASSAVAMMDALLAYSRSGRTELRKKHLDMRSLVQDVYDELVISSPQMRCEIKIGDLPDAHADEDMMRFVFTNLIGNACKFIRPDDTANVEVGGSLGSNEVMYFVRDEGIGFDMRFADKLFKVFERLHPGERFSGHGVGLAIVARMVRRHGGRVWAQGAVGKGATFYFTIASNVAAAPAETGAMHG